jgi:N-acetylglucosaminyldiphosphoundecaprenol N-acetyl-beta-D-mannosaminyltransferase
VVSERIELLKVPIDIIPPEKVEDIIYDLLKEREGRNIVLLSLWDLLRARRNAEYRQFISSAALVIPISRSITGGIRFLHGKKNQNYMPFNFIVNLLTILERREFTVYLLGAKATVLSKTEKHIHETFPSLRIIGRFPGHFKVQNQENLVQVIRKSAPSLLLVNQGVPGGEKWIARNNAKLNKGLRLWCSDIFDVFADRRRRPSQWAFNRGLEWVGYCFQNPFRIFRLFLYLYYSFLLIISKFRTILKPKQS